jgi:hypothetical protein
MDDAMRSPSYALKTPMDLVTWACPSSERDAPASFRMGSAGSDTADLTPRTRLPDSISLHTCPALAARRSRFVERSRGQIRNPSLSICLRFATNAYEVSSGPYRCSDAHCVARGMDSSRSCTEVRRCRWATSSSRRPNSPARPGRSPTVAGRAIERSKRRRFDSKAIDTRWSRDRCRSRSRFDMTQRT